MPLNAMLAALMVAVQPTTPQYSCDADCIAILTAVAEWGVSQAAGNRHYERERTFLFVPTGPSPYAPVYTDVRVQHAMAITEIAGRLGLPTTDELDGDEFLACQERHEDACRAAAGTTVIRVMPPNFVSDDEAEVTIAIRSIYDIHPEFMPLARGQAGGLAVSRVDGEWKVTGQTGVWAVG